MFCESLNIIRVMVELTHLGQGQTDVIIIIKSKGRVVVTVRLEVIFDLGKYLLGLVVLAGLAEVQTYVNFEEVGHIAEDLVAFVTEVGISLPVLAVSVD